MSMNFVAFMAPQNGSFNLYKWLAEQSLYTNILYDLFNDLYEEGRKERRMKKETGGGRGGLMSKDVSLAKVGFISECLHTF